MEKRIVSLLLALCCLSACGAPAEPPREGAPAPQEPVRQAEPAPKEEPADAELHKIELKPYKEWTFEPEPLSLIHI